jgi:hypothetical protein
MSSGFGVNIKNYELRNPHSEIELEGEQDESNGIG